MVRISENLSVPDEDIEISAVRAGGPGGQHVNKVSSAIHLRFDIRRSSLPAWLKQRLLSLQDQRINKEGVVVIKGRRYREREKNEQDARNRLRELIVSASRQRKVRLVSKPSLSSQQKRLERKRRHGRTKALRRNVLD
jgi:ribosome-associated protein